MSDILNQAVPDISLNGTTKQVVNLKDFKGKNIVLYFYPKDNTPGCDKEAQDFRDHYDAFLNLNTLIVGVSRDSIASHERFREKFELPFILLSDHDETLCRAFGVLKEKNMFGKKCWGIERSTFLIDTKGIIIQEWRKVSVDAHCEEVLEKVKTLA